MVSESSVRIALSTINDPHVPVSLERMGMLRSIHIEANGVVHIELGIPCLACPGVSMLKQEITAAVSAIQGVSSVEIDEGWHHEWDITMIAPEARVFMQQNGIQT